MMALDVVFFGILIFCLYIWQNRGWIVIRNPLCPYRSVGKISPLGHSKNKTSKRHIQGSAPEAQRFQCALRTEDLLNPHRRTAGGEALYNSTMSIGIVGD